MRVDVLTVGMFQSNCYVVSCEETKEAIVIDAGDEADRIVDHVRGEDLRIRMIVSTHAHVDHVSALGTVAKTLSVPVLMHEGELPIYENIRQQAAVFGLGEPDIVDVDRLISHGDTIEFGSLTGEVIHTPGHSPGGVSIAFRDENPPKIFVGDVLFRGSIGRTDLMGANPRQMVTTLKKIILKLPDDMVVYSGHGPETTIGLEKRSNPFLIDVDGWSGQL